MSFELWRPELPEPGVIAFLAPCLAMWILGSGGLAGWLKLRRGLRMRRFLHQTFGNLRVALPSCAMQWCG